MSLEEQKIAEDPDAQLVERIFSLSRIQIDVDKKKKSADGADERSMTII